MTASTEPPAATQPASSPKTANPLRNAAAFSLAFMVQRAIGFITLPLYTRAVTPAEYGVLGLLVSIAGATTILFALGLDQPLFRTYYQLQDEPERRRAYIGTTWRFTIWFPLSAAILVSLISAPLLGDSAPFTVDELALALVGSAIGVAAMTVPGTVLRAAEAVRPYVVLTMVTAFVAPTCGILLVVVADLGVRGFLIGTIVANLATLAVAASVVPWERHVPFNASDLKHSLKFGLPLVPHFLSHWALQIADRLLLAGLVTTAVLGYYSLAANIAVPFMVAASSLNQGFMPTYARAGKDPGLHAELRGAVVQQVTIVAAIVVAGTLMGPPLVRLLSPPEYHDAASLIAWLVLGYGFMGLYYIPMNVATLTVGRSKFAWIATAISAAVNLGLIVWLVPSRGVIAAAQASAVGYFVLLVLISIYAHARPNPLTYDWRRIAPAIGLAIVVYAAGSTLNFDAAIVELVVRGFVWLGFLALLAAIGLIPIPERVRRIGRRTPAESM